MFSRIYVENFRSFREFELDLLETSNPKKIKQALFVYGENGSGKSNLVEIFTFFVESMRTLKNNLALAEAANKLQGKNNDEAYLKRLNDFLARHPLAKTTTLNGLVANVKTLGVNKKNENMFVQLHFVLNHSSSEGVYIMEFDDNGQLIYESLDYLIDKKVGNLYTIENKNDEIITKYSPKFFKGGQRKFKEEIEFDIESYWGKNSLLSILTHKTNIMNSTLLINAINENFWAVFDFFNSISIIHKGSEFETGYLPVSLETMKELEEGSIKLSDQKGLDELLTIERMLNDFYTSLYSDIQKIEYDRTEDATLLNYELTVHKRIGGEVVIIPFKKESQGTKNLLELFPTFISLLEGNVVIIDEIDTGIHDLLMSSLMTKLLEESTGQFIVTTHNTQLLENIEPNHVGIIAVDSQGNKFMNLLKNSTIQKNNNLLNKYQKGEFYGIPEIFDIDFSHFKEMIHETKSINIHITGKQGGKN